MSEEARASGKVILFGEHAVVYGIPAIAVGIDRGARARATLTRGAPRPGLSSLEVPGWQLKVSDAPSAADAPIARAFRDLLAATREAVPDLATAAVVADADLPPGGGLGCSAALGVAVARALDPSAKSDVVAARANAWERVFHGNPSGVDAAVAAFGGAVVFERREGNIPRVAAVVGPSPLHLAIGNTGQASSTKSMVDAVARLRERRPEIAAKTFDAIHTLVKNARLAIEAGDMKAIGQLLDLNQMLLAGLFVSTSDIEQMCALARGAGALGAKLTGAGGGGCVVALVEEPEKGREVLEAWAAEGKSGFLTCVDVTPMRELRRDGHEAPAPSTHDRPEPRP